MDGGIFLANLSIKSMMEGMWWMLLLFGSQTLLVCGGEEKSGE